MMKYGRAESNVMLTHEKTVYEREFDTRVIIWGTLEVSTELLRRM